MKFEYCPYCNGGGVVCCALCGSAGVVPEALLNEYTKKSDWSIEEKIALREKYATVPVLKSDLESSREERREDQGKVIKLTNENTTLRAELDRQSEARLGQQRYIIQLEKNESAAVKAIEDLRAELESLKEMESKRKICGLVNIEDYEEVTAENKRLREALRDIARQGSLDRARFFARKALGGGA